MPTVEGRRGRSPTPKTILSGHELLPKSSNNQQSPLIPGSIVLPNDQRSPLSPNSHNLAPFVHCTMHGSEVLVLELEAPIERIKSCDGAPFANNQIDWYSEVVRLEGECEKQYRLNLALMEQLRIATSVADERLAELQEAEGELEECKIALSSANQRIEELEYALWVEHCPGASHALEPSNKLPPSNAQEQLLVDAISKSLRDLEATCSLLQQPVEKFYFSREPATQSSMRFAGEHKSGETQPEALLQHESGGQPGVKLFAPPPQHKAIDRESDEGAAACSVCNERMEDVVKNHFLPAIIRRHLHSQHADNLRLQSELDFLQDHLRQSLHWKQKMLI
uniref:Uncharacterized protein n=1 Tax=Hanusia phi TaxID=3032 RepID=A0A7S0HU53_9CRYP|mmetsp:Transcript_4266/g.10334  ORF Transcript_4266/g.10334 Transcript_4266/m.10334 type:complete len:337 (+) Transcript_4266:70-1080(+)